MRVLLRHNLLLDGTVLALLQPMLQARKGSASRGAQPLDDAIDLSAVGRARNTITDLIVALASLDEETNGAVEHPASDTSSRSADQGRPLAFLEARGFDVEFPAVWSWLLATTTPEEDVHFIFGSYVVFLQTFIMRAAARNLVELPDRLEQMRQLEE